MDFERLFSALPTLVTAPATNAGLRGGIPPRSGGGRIGIVSDTEWTTVVSSAVDNLSPPHVPRFVRKSDVPALRGKHTRSVFSDAAQFHDVMRTEELRGFVVTRAGEFQALLTQVSLRQLRLCAVEEDLPSISFITVPHDKVLV